jgi:hypothetical protein
MMEVSHMGRSDYDTENCWAFDDASPIGISLISQTGWVEGANGDKVFWHGGPPEATETFNMAALTYRMGPFQITGGTGRFQGATGWLVTWGTMSADISTGTECWDGMISTVGSIK